MDLSLTEEHEMVARMARDFAEKEVTPVIKEYDREHKVNRNAMKRMAELGICGICIPVRYGGQGMDYIALGLVCEELERVDTSLRVVMSVHVGLNSMGLLQWATEDQKQRFLIPQARGERMATYGLTEPGAGSDAVAITATARGLIPCTSTPAEHGSTWPPRNSLAQPSAIWLRQELPVQRKRTLVLLLNRSMFVGEPRACARPGQRDYRLLP